MKEISTMRPRRFSVVESTDSYGDTISKPHASGNVMKSNADTGGEKKGQLNPDHAKVIKNATWYPTMSGYGYYRLSLFAASGDGTTQISPQSPSAEHPFSAAYTQEEQAILDNAAKLGGFKPQKLSDKFSAEPDDVQKISPVNSNSGRNVYSESEFRRRLAIESKEDMMVVNSDTGGQGEGKLNPDHASALPNANWYPEMTPYGHMRSLIMAASLPNEPTMAKSSPVSDHPFSAGYSDWDQQIIDRAAQLCGFKPAKLSNRYSEEQKEVHKVSPVNPHVKT